MAKNVVIAKCGLYGYDSNPLFTGSLLLTPAGCIILKLPNDAYITISSVPNISLLDAHFGCAVRAIFAAYLITIPCHPQTPIYLQFRTNIASYCTAFLIH